MEGFIGSSVCRGVRSCWARRGRGSCSGYQRLRAASTTTTPGRGTRLGRRTTVLGSAAWSRLGRLRLRRRQTTSTPPRWTSPLQLINRILDTYISSMLTQPLSTLKAAGVSSATAGVSSAAAAPVVRSPSSSPPKLLRRDASPGSSSRRRDGTGGRGVMLNICVAEVLLRRTTSEVRRSPLQQQTTKDARRSSSVRA